MMALLPTILLLLIRTEELYVPCEVFGFMMRPNFKYHYQSADVDNWVYTNMYSLHDNDVGEKLKPRFIFLGDSYVESLQVPVNDMFSKVFEREMNCEAINAGKSGWSSVPELLYLMKLGIHFQPDFVVHCFTPSDITDDWVARNQYEFNGQGFPESFQPGNEKNAQSIDQLSRPDYKEMLEWQKVCILNMIKFCSSKHIQYIFVMVPISKQSFSGKIEEIETDMNRFMDEVKCPHIESLSALFHSQPDLYFKEGHLNKKGHELLGKILADKLSGIVNNPAVPSAY
jgi:hypothetical protein